MKRKRAVNAQRKDEPGKSASVDPLAVMELAKAGLLPAEIAAKLGCELAQIEALSPFVQKGYALGTAELKLKLREDGLRHDGASRRYLLDALAVWPNGARPPLLQTSELRQAQLEKTQAEGARWKSGQTPTEIHIDVVEGKATHEISPEEMAQFET